MPLLLKDPNAQLDYAVDWGSQYLADEVLISSDWSIDPADEGGATIASSRTEGFLTLATVEGGSPGTVYRLTNQVVTSAGRKDSRSIMLRVESR